MTSGCTLYVHICTIVCTTQPRNSLIIIFVVPEISVAMVVALVLHVFVGSLEVLN